MTIQKENASSILEANIHSHGDDRSNFYATKDEMICLCEAGANKVRWNYDQGDGTYTHEVEFRGYKFLCSTIEPIK